MASIGATHTPVKQTVRQQSIESEIAENELQKLAALAPLQTDLKSLRKALAYAESLGVNTPTIKRAVSKVQYVERAQAALTQKRLMQELLELTSLEPMDIDIQQLDRALGEARTVECPKDVLLIAQQKLDQATREQAKRRTATDTLELKVKQLQQVLSEETIEGVRSAINGAVAVGVPEAKLEPAREEIRLAEIAIKARAGCQEALMRAAGKSVQLLDVSALRETLQAAKMARVDEEKLQHAQEQLTKAERRDAAALVLKEATSLDDGPPPAPKAWLDSLRQAWAEALSSGVEMERVGAAYQQLLAWVDCPNLKQTPFFAESRLSRLSSRPPMQLEIPAMSKAISVAEALDVDDAALSRARAALAKAQEAQEERDSALVEMMLASVPFSVDVERLEPALKRAEAAGVAEALVRVARARLEAAGASSGNPLSRRSKSSGVERVQFTPSLLGSMLDEAAADAASKEQRWKEASDGAAQLREQAVQKAAAAAAAVAAAEKSEARARHNEERKGRTKDEIEEMWSAVAKTRHATLSADGALHAAFIAAVEAAHEEEEAERLALAASTDVLWAKEVDELKQSAVRQGKMLSTSSVVTPSSGGLLKCCGGGGGVIETVEEKGADEHGVVRLESINLNVADHIISPEADLLASVVDACSWAPLYVPSPHWQLKMLVGLAHRGMYNNPAVCAAVARGVCVQNCAVAARFVESLSATTPAAPLYEAVCTQVFSTWVSQLLQVSSKAIVLKPEDGTKDSPAAVLEEVPQQLGSEESRMNHRHDYLLAVEVLLSVLGRLLGRASGWLPLAGASAVVRAWEASAAPALLSSAVADHLVDVMEHNMAAHVPPKTMPAADRESLPREAGEYKTFEGLDRASDHLQVVILAVAHISWKMTDGMSAFFLLMNSCSGADASPGVVGCTFARSYFPAGSELRRLICTMLLEEHDYNTQSPPAPKHQRTSTGGQPRQGFKGVVSSISRTRSAESGNTAPAAGEKRDRHCIDRRWATQLQDRLVAEALLWTKAGCALYTSPDFRPRTVDELSAYVSELFEAEDGTRFYLSFLESFCAPAETDDVDLVLSGGSVTLDLKAGIRALIGHHHTLSATIEDNGVDSSPGLQLQLKNVFTSIVLVLSASMSSSDRFKQILPEWLHPKGAASPAQALAGTASQGLEHVNCRREAEYQLCARAIASSYQLVPQFVESLFGDEAGYKERRDKGCPTPHDKKNERVLMAMVALFVERPDDLTGFQMLVPRVFDVYLAKGSALRTELCNRLTSAGHQKDVVARIATEDELVRQRFFWSAPGMKLFGGHSDLQDPAKLAKLVMSALQQQPSIMTAFLQQRIKSAEATPVEDNNLGVVVPICLTSLLKHVEAMKPEWGPPSAWVIPHGVHRDTSASCDLGKEHALESSPKKAHGERTGPRREMRSRTSSRVNGASRVAAQEGNSDATQGLVRASSASSDNDKTTFTERGKSFSQLAAPQGRPQDGVLTSLELILQTSITFEEAVLSKVLPVWLESESSPELLDAFMVYALPRIEAGVIVPEMQGDTPPTEEADTEAAKAEAAREHTALILALAALFVEKPDKLTAFKQLVPQVFSTHLKLGTDARARLNAMLLRSAFDERLERLISETDELVAAPFFWNDKVMPLCTKKRILADYASLNEAQLTRRDGTTLHLYSSLLSLLLRLTSHVEASETEIAKRTKEVLDQFQRNPDQQQFLLAIFDKLDQRSRERPDDFTGFDLTVLSQVAQNGVHTLSSVSGEKMHLVERSMTTLLQSYITHRDPKDWKALFMEATNIGFMIKYMFRENLAIAKAKFTEAVTNSENFKKMPQATQAQELLTRLVNDTLAAYGDTGIYDPERLADIDFLSHPEALVELVREGRTAHQRPRDMELLIQITEEWMMYMMDQKFPPLTPHHTQAFTVMMMSRCFIENVPARVASNIPNWDAIKPKELEKAKSIRASLSGSKTLFKPRAFIAQMATGEGKSIVIAMLAVFMVRLYGMRVHVLENNEGLLERDFRQNLPFFARFGLKCSKDLSDAEANICYCLKAAINKRFLRCMIEGRLDEELATTVLIVDEVDDLVVNERPNNHYVKKDSERTPDLRRCYEELATIPYEDLGTAKMPESVMDPAIWEFALKVVEHVKKNVVKEKHYRVLIDDDGNKVARMLDDDGKLPKVPLTAPWLQYVNFLECDVDANSESRYACVCTPYIFNKYAGIFGLTGSVGGRAELSYLTRTYEAVKFDVPRFLDTCIGDARKEVINHGVEIADNHKALVKRVVQLAAEYHKRVPVLVIASSLSELSELHASITASKEILPERVQRLSEFDASGRSLKGEWATLIDDATKRVGLAGESSCRVTVTDRFGGRGHDFQVVDKEANANGGMLVIATSIPDEREWIQWRGRTARQDRPGQFYVILDKQAKPFSSNPRIVDKLKKAKNEDAKIEILLDHADEHIGDRLREFSGEQATGEKLNELTEIYYKQYPRGFDEPWPQPDNRETDRLLRQFLSVHTHSKPEEVKRAAKEIFSITLS